ncbi:MAG: bifunctional nuclease family protein [Muribaculaceae bacterium]|nr:bifunctional nuclease family protein [Muribaculaceae bacterium]
MRENRVKLQVVGLSYSHIQTGAYALILGQVDGPYKIPVVIGPTEAQSIALRMEGINPPRPLTHDLFNAMVHAFGIQLTEVFIYRFEDGIFSSELTFTDGERTIVLDSRTSDAIAIAMRTGAPIYTTREIVENTGFTMEQISGDDDDSNPFEDEIDLPDDSTEPGVNTPRLENYTIEELERTLARLIENEDYEQAAVVNDILKKKRDAASSSE